MLFSPSELAEFARDCLGKRDRSRARYTFRLYACPACAGQVFILTVEHHTGSEVNDFRGIIHGQCVACDESTRLYAFTGEHRQIVEEEGAVCSCGGNHFMAAECERFEGAGGLQGFFDEGVVVTYCVACGENDRLVMAD